MALYVIDSIAVLCQEAHLSLNICEFHLPLLEFPQNDGNKDPLSKQINNCFDWLIHTGTESESEPAHAEVPAQPPSFVKPIPNTLVVEGSPARFEAVFTGMPAPEITWLKNGEIITDSRDFKVC